MSDSLKASIEKGAKGKGDTLVIRIPMQTPTPSSTGKTLVVATSHGNQETDVMVDGMALKIGVNAFISKR